jgi:hypothetical protein
MLGSSHLANAAAESGSSLVSGIGWSSMRKNRFRSREDSRNWAAFNQLSAIDHRTFGD